MSIEGSSLMRCRFEEDLRRRHEEEMQRLREEDEKIMEAEREVQEDRIKKKKASPPERRYRLMTIRIQSSILSSSADALDWVMGAP